MFDTSKVDDFWVEGQWDNQMLVEQAPLIQLATIQAISISQHQYPNQAYWKINPNEMCTSASA